MHEGLGDGELNLEAELAAAMSMSDEFEAAEGQAGEEGHEGDGDDGRPGWDPANEVMPPGPAPGSAVGKPPVFPFELEVANARVAEAIAMDAARNLDNVARARSRQAAQHAGLTQHFLSLVRVTTTEAETSVFIVRWEDVARRLGRRVRIDSLNRVIYQFLPVQSFGAESAHVVIADVMVLMLPIGRVGRSKLPDWVLDVWRSEEAWLCCGPRQSTESRQLLCLGCLHAVRLGGNTACKARADSGDLFCCSGCLSMWHMECHHGFAKASGKALRDCEAHDLGSSFACLLCQP